MPGVPVTIVVVVVVVAAAGAVTVVVAMAIVAKLQVFLLLSIGDCSRRSSEKKYRESIQFSA